MAAADNLPGGSIIVFLIQQAWAALFGGLMLGAIILATSVHLPFFAPYDWLFIFAIAIQLFMLATRLEKPHELITIVLFHLVGLWMELFKTSSAIGAWAYPGSGVIKIAHVPLFAGFMYSAVGSYMARAWRVLQLTFSHYPNRKLTAILATAIYINFFTHHYIYDFRYVLFIAVLVLYGKVQVFYTINKRTRSMPLVLGFILIAVSIWLAENIGTITKVWLYPSQVKHWHMVGIQKIGSWLLLMVISFIMVDLLHYWRGRRATKTLQAS